MNQTTQDVIEFLTHPETRWGDPEALPMLLADPPALHEAVREMLDDAPAFLDSAQTEDLRRRLPEADWPAVTREFQTRLNMASGFFDPDAEAHKD